MILAMCLFTSRLINKNCILKIKIRSEYARNCVIMFTLMLYIENHYDKMLLPAYTTYVNNNMIRALFR